MQLVGMIIGVSLVPLITAAIGYRATAWRWGCSAARSSFIHTGVPGAQ
jgi:hypothetical protein